MTYANVFTKTTRDRWRGMAIAVVTLGLLLLFAMSVYRDIDISFYTDLPEVFRALIDIPPDADIGSLAYGAIFGTYGGLTMAALVLTMGAASIAGEERDGTIGLLLGNPVSRTHVLVSKAAAMVLLTFVGILLLWAAGWLTPIVLNVSIVGVHIGALMFHMGVMALFFGFMALAIGAWTGSRGAASGISAGVLFVSFIGAGLFPVIEGWENAAKVFPWYYFNASNPVTHGIDWGHVAVLAAGSAVFLVVAVVGVNRRDLKSQTVATTILDRLRANPMTHKLIDRLQGSARVSKIWVKTASDHQGVLLVTAGIMIWMTLIIGPMYPLINDAMAGFADQFPESLLALFGGGDITTPEGFYQIEVFGMMAPIAVMVVTMAVGTRALAGEEERRTMGLLLANPVKRSTIVIQKSITMILFSFVIGISLFASTLIGSLLGGLGMDVGGIAAVSLLASLVGLVFGALSLALSAGTGRLNIAMYGTVGVALVLYVWNAFVPFSEGLAGLAKWSPFYYYLTSDPLLNGMHWGHGAVLVTLSVMLIAASVFLFERRDLRQTG